MAKTIKIPVPEGINGHGKIYTEVELREPTFDEYLEIGEIYTAAQLPDKTVFSVESAEKIRQYIDACLVSPKDPLLLPQGGVKLARALKGAVLGFFQDEASGTGTSKTSQTTSSSDAEKDASTPKPSDA